MNHYMIRARVGRIGLRMPRSRSSASVACSDVRLWWGLDQEKRGALGAVLDTLWNTPVADIMMGVRHGKLVTMGHPVLKKYLKQPAQLTVVSEDDGKWMIREVFEEECYAAFVDALPERGATVVDVGANIGAFALFCAQRRPSATVLCLEPVPSTAAALAANVAAISGNAGRVHVVQKGLTAPGQQGLMKFTCFEDVPSCSTVRPQDKYAANIAPLYDASNFLNYYAKEKPLLCAFVRCLPAALQQPVLRAALAHAWRFSHRECELTTLGKCFESSGLPAPSTIDLLKVDVEGLELHVLEAIEPEWWPKVQSVAVEVHDLDGRLARVRALLSSLGFEVETKSDDVYNDQIGMNHHFVYAKRSSSSIGRDVSEAEPLLGALKDQYDSKEALTFYNEVMGGGGGNIHYGIFRSEEDGVREAADASVDLLAASINAHRPLRGARVLDVGSGTGAAAHVLLQQWNCASVLGFNLCPGQNATANELARELGVGERFGTVEGNFDEDLPPSLRGETFDAIWSQEAFCHSKDKAALIARLADRLAPGGVLGFTDIMAGEDATAEQLRTFTDRNATSEMARCSDYIGYLRAAGLELATVSDMTRHLPRFFSLMAARIDASRSSLAAAGVSDEYMTNFRDSLRARVDFSRAGAFAWAFVVARKPGAPPEARSGLTGTLAGGGQGIATFAISGRASRLGGRAGPRRPRGGRGCGGHVPGEQGRAGRPPRGPAALREGVHGRRPLHLRARRRAARQRAAPARRGHPHVRRHQDVRPSRGARRRAGDAPRVRDPQRHGAAHPAALQRGGVRRLELRAPRRPRRPQPGPVGPAPGAGGARGTAREGRHLRHVRRRRLRPALPHQASRQHRGLAARCAPRFDLCAARGQVLGRGGPAPERVHGCVAS